MRLLTYKSSDFYLAKFGKICYSTGVSNQKSFSSFSTFNISVASN